MCRREDVTTLHPIFRLLEKSSLLDEVANDMHNLFTEFSTKAVERPKRKSLLAKTDEQSNVG